MANSSIAPAGQQPPIVKELQWSNEFTQHVLSLGFLILCMLTCTEQCRSKQHSNTATNQQSTKTTTQQPYVHLGYLAASNREFFMIPLIPGLLLLLAGSFQLYFRKKRYFKTSIASIIIGLLFIAMAICFFFDKPNIPTKIISLTNLKGLSTPMTIYAQEYDGKLPNSENWCDLLVMKMDFRKPEQTGSS